MPTQYFDSPIGILVVGADDTGVCWVDSYCQQTTNENPNEHTQAACKAIGAYFTQKTPISLPHISLRGSNLQLAVWKALQTIPFGKTATYQDIAKIIGKPQAYRAVGTAIGQNPLPIVIPCHRVIRANGDMGQFGLGADVKKWLLDWEK